MVENLRSTGVQFIVAAQQKEDERDFLGAINSYSSGIEHLECAAKYERNEKAKQITLERIKPYRERVESLRQLLSQPVAREQPAGTLSSSARADNEIRQRATELILASESCNVKWTDIAGLEDVKESLKQSVVYPLKMPQLFESGRVEAWSGILLYGSPGTGKTLIAKAVATEAGVKTFMHVSVAEIMGKYVGDSERMVAAVFRVAREHAPTVIFIDEVDCIASQRTEGEHDVSRKVKNQLLLEMNGVGSGTERVLVLAATNMPWLLDDAFLRRMQKRVLVPLPDIAARRTIVENELKKMKAHSLTADQIDQIAQKTDAWSGSDIATLIKIARNRQMTILSHATHFCPNGHGDSAYITMCAPDAKGAHATTLDDIIREGLGDRIVLPDVSYDDFCVALQTTRPASNTTDYKKMQEFTASQGSK